MASRSRPPAVVLGRVPPWVVRWLLLPLALLVVSNALVVGTFRVTGSSMEDTLEPGDFLIVSKVGASAARVSDWLGEPAVSVARGDLVVFRLPRNPSLVLVKRVVGIPGDRVEIEEGKVTVDGSDQRPVRGDSTVGAAVTQEADAVRGRFDGIVPPGAVFVLGDNRVPGASSDSREWGYLPSREIIGTAVMRILPPRRAGWLVRQRSP